MIISHSEDIGQDLLVQKYPKNAIIIDSAKLDLDEYISAIKKAEKNEFNYIFVSSDKNDVLKDNNIRYYTAFYGEKSLENEKNQIRLNKDEKIYNKFVGFEDIETR